GRAIQAGRAWVGLIVVHPCAAGLDGATGSVGDVLLSAPDVRAWDTMGEISVLVAAGTGVAGLIFVRGRKGHLHRFERKRDGTEAAGRIRFHPVSEEVADLHHPEREDLSQKRVSWLIAGRTLA